MDNVLTRENVINILKTEQECVMRQEQPTSRGCCVRDAHGRRLCEYCDLCVPTSQVLAAYEFAINAIIDSGNANAAKNLSDAGDDATEVNDDNM